MRRWSTRLCLNGHKWAKRQPDKRGICYDALDNSSLSIAGICDSLGRSRLSGLPKMARPHSATALQEQQAGYPLGSFHLAVEVTLTQILDWPQCHGRTGEQQEESHLVKRFLQCKNDY